MEDNNKVLVAISDELRAIKKALAELKEVQSKPVEATEKPLDDYVSTTEQRFTNLNQKLDRVLATCGEQKFYMMIFAVGGMALGLSVIIKEVVTRIIQYVTTL